jgi:uncharacterized membrane protein
MSDIQRTTEQRLDDLERKIDHIVNILGINSLKKQPDLYSVQMSEPKADDLPPPLPKALTLPAKSINFLPILAVICFFLAGIFIVKLTIESGWLTPERQWGLLTLFGIVLVSFSLFFEKIERSYRSYIGAAGVTVLYLSAYSSFLYFGLFDPITGIALGGLVSLLCFYLFHYFKSELFVVVCTIGTYISPVLLNKQVDLIYLSAFFLIWAGIFSRMAIYFQTRTFTLMASYLGLGIFAYLNLEVKDPEVLLSIIIIQSLQFIIYAGGVYYYSLKNKTYLSKVEAIAYLPILLFFYGTIYYFLNIYNSEIAPWISLGFAGFIYLLYWRASKNNIKLESENLVQSFFSVVLFHSGYVQLVPAEGKPWLLPLIIFAIYISEQKNKLTKLALPLRVMFMAISVIEFFDLCFKLLTEMNTISIVPAFFTIALGIFYYLKGAKAVKNKEGLFLSLLHIISILSLYRLAFDYGSLAVTVAWGVYSIIVLVFGYMKRNAIVAKSSLIVLMVATFKALIYDASQSSSGSRIGSLILTGVVLYGAGYMFQKINKWSV